MTCAQASTGPTLKAAPMIRRAITTQPPRLTTIPASSLPAAIPAAGPHDGTGSVVDGDSDDDGVCDDDEIAGCQDELACNYNPNATDAATCEYATDGFDCDGNPLRCPEDINGNGTVEVSDVLLLLSDFGCTSDCTGRTSTETARLASETSCSCSPRLERSASVPSTGWLEPQKLILCYHNFKPISMAHHLRSCFQRSFTLLMLALLVLVLPRQVMAQISQGKCRKMEHL